MVRSFVTAINFGVGNIPHSVAVGDFNSDTNLDLAVANAGSQSETFLYF